MEKLKQNILELADRYPDQVRIYPPADSRKIAFAETYLGFELHPLLQEFYRFSNGLSIIDYCVCGVLGSKVMNLHGANLRGGVETRHGNVMELVGTSGDEKYCQIVSGEKNGGMVRQETMMGDYHYIADDLESFFERFLAKSNILLEHFKPEDIVLYFDDPSLPAGMDEW